MSKQSRAERLDRFNKRMDDFQAKVNDMAEDRELRIDTKKEVREKRLENAKAKVESNKTRVKDRQSSFKDSMDAQMDAMNKNLEDARAKLIARKDARDQKKLEKYIDDRLDYADSCILAAMVSLDDARVAFLEALDAAVEYDERFSE
ncbi:MAG: hypothetical protein J5674_05420 [Candidatus Methanomethylophilaceae archaeon]|nr:hypothetical protein [Candidatus Methanomethylophilaceae archaeon]